MGKRVFLLAVALTLALQGFQLYNSSFQPHSNAVQDEFTAFKTNITRVRLPEPAKEEELTVRSGDVTLAGTLFLPKRDKAPLVIFTHGAERASRKSAFYRLWASTFAANGVACLIFDKRGVGDSGGTYIELPDLRVPADDVVAWAELLAKRQDVDREHFGVMGASQGGWVGPLGASRSPMISFVVAISGTPVSPLQQGFYAREQELRRAGFSEEQVGVLIGLSMKSSEYVRTGEGYQALSEEWKKHESELWFKRAKDKIVPPLVPPANLGHALLASFKDPWRMLYDPLPALTSLKVPSVWIYGEKDTVVDSAASSAILGRIDHGSGRFQVHTYPGANHGMLLPGEPGIWIYAPGYFDTVVEWVLKTAR